MLVSWLSTLHIKSYLLKKYDMHSNFQMEKDFMRSTTVAIFIPMTFAELFNIYSEVVAYMNLFSETEQQYEYIYE